MKRSGPTTAECEVLIIAEDRQIRELLHQIFLVEGYTCQVASDAREGLAVFKARRSPLVLTEIDMQGMTGVEFLRQVRAIDAGVAVIMLAGASDVKTAIDCLKLGADAYITKPMNVGELLTAAERALKTRHRRLPKPRPAPRHRSDDARTVWRTPEQFLDSFEHFHRAPHSRHDPQFTVGIPIIRQWINIRAGQPVSQTDLDALLAQFTAAAVAGIDGTPLFDLWAHIVRWGAELGLSVPSRHPWVQP